MQYIPSFTFSNEFSINYRLEMIIQAITYICTIPLARKHVHRNVVKNGYTLVEEHGNLILISMFRVVLYISI